jgi:hypothetical protein
MSFKMLLQRLRVGSYKERVETNLNRRRKEMRRRRRKRRRKKIGCGLS